MDKRSGTSSGNGFLSSLGKEVSRGLNTVMGDLRMSPKTSPRDLEDLRVASAPNMIARPSLGSTGGSGTSISCGGSMPGAAALLSSGEGANRASGIGPLGLEDVSWQLPPGWEAKYDVINKRLFYVDHNNKTTTWERPAAVLLSPNLPGAALTAVGIHGAVSRLGQGDATGLMLPEAASQSGASGSSVRMLDGGNGRTGIPTPKSLGHGPLKMGIPDGAGSDLEGIGTMHTAIQVPSRLGGTCSHECHTCKPMMW